MKYKRSPSAEVLQPRVLALVQLPPPIHGAALRNFEFCEYLQGRSDLQLRVVAIGGGGAIDRVGVVSLVKIARGVKIVLTAIALFMSYAYSRKKTYVYITPAPSGLALWRDALLVALATYLFGLEVVAHFRATGIEKQASFSKWVLACSYRSARAIAMSRIAAKDIFSIFDRSRIDIVQNGIKDYSNTLVRSATDEEFTVLHLSNLCREKGTDDAIRAFAQAYSRNNNMKLVLAGAWASKRDEVYCRELIKRSGIEKATELAGKVGGEDKWNVFHKADCFIFPTKYPKECFPGVVLEAMSCGLATVAYKHASIPEILTDGIDGALADVGDVNHLSLILSELLDNKILRIKIGKNAREKFISRFRAELTHPLLTTAIFGK